MKEVQFFKEILTTLIKRPVIVSLKGPEKIEFSLTVQGILGNVLVGTSEETEEKVQFIAIDHIGYISTDNVLLVPEVEETVQIEPEYQNILQAVLKQENNNNKQEGNSNNSQQSSKRGTVVY